MKTLDVVKIRQHPRLRSRSLKLIVIGSLIVALTLLFENIRVFSVFGMVIATVGSITGAVGSSITIRPGSLAYGTATITADSEDIVISVVESGIEILRPKKRELFLRETDYHPEDWPLVAAFFQGNQKPAEQAGDGDAEEAV
jgi:hypothetical protein